MSDALHRAAAAVDVMATAARIMAFPGRHAPSATAGEVLALAAATLATWEIAQNGELLAKAVALPATDAGRDFAVTFFANRVTAMMAAIRGEQTPTEQEKSDGEVEG